MDIPKYSGSGVYKIDFGIGVYVGSSINVRKRLQQHIAMAKAGKQPPKLQRAFDVCPDPHVDILERIGDNDTRLTLLRREQYWIKVASAGGLNSAPEQSLTPEEDIKGILEIIAEYQRRIAQNRKYIKQIQQRYLVTIGEMRGKHEAKNTEKSARR